MEGHHRIHSDNIKCLDDTESLQCVKPTTPNSDCLCRFLTSVRSHPDGMHLECLRYRAWQGCRAQQTHSLLIFSLFSHLRKNKLFIVSIFMYISLTLNIPSLYDIKCSLFVICKVDTSRCV